MKRLASLFLAVLFLFSVVPAFAATTKTTSPAPAVKSANSPEKDQLIANLNNMRNQEVRVIILQQLINEEAGKLNAVQESFCKTYKLDVDKLRKGLYRYDDNQGKFVEMKVESAQK